MEDKHPLEQKEVRLYLKCGSVSAEELSEVLAGFSELFSLASREIGNPHTISIKVNDLKIGSIEISSILELWSNTKAMVLGSDAQAILSIVGLVSIIKKVFKDIGSAQEGLCSACGYIIKPLKKMLSVIHDKDSFARLESSEGNIVISGKDADVIRSLKEEDTLINENEITQYYSIFSLTFKRGAKDFNKWKLADGDNVFPAVIEDKDFLKLINEQNFAIHRNDLLLCKVRVIQCQSSQGLRTEMTVKKVLEYKHAPEQQELKLE